MAKQQKYFIGPSLLSDIRKTITRVDAIAPTTSGAAMPVRLQDLQRPGMRLTRGTFTGTWNIGETKSVTIQGSTNTVAVTNYCVPVKPDTSSTQSYNVIFGSVMGTQTSVEIEQSIEIEQSTSTCTFVVGGLDLTALPGYDVSAIQLLGHDAGSTASTACLSLKWFSVSTCGTATAT